MPLSFLLVLLLLGFLPGPAAPAETLEVVWRRTPPTNATYTILEGTSVTWMVASGTHTVTSVSGTENFHFQAGAPWNFTHKFDHVGSTYYHCTFHTTMMNGTITVVALPDVVWQLPGTTNLALDSNRTVYPGATVVWHIRGAFHSVVSDPESPESFDSGEMGDGGSFSYTFNNLGSFPYSCGIHGSMTGVITVVEEPTTTEEPTTSEESTTTEEPTTTTTATTTTATTSSTTTTATPTETDLPVVQVDWDISQAGIQVAAQIGQKVRWTNGDSSPHTVTSLDDEDKRGKRAVSFDSGNLDPGDFFEFTFTEAGSYKFHCLYHEGMTGVVNVEVEGQESSGAQKISSFLALVVGGVVFVWLG